MNTILCIDTASDRFAVAIDRDGTVASYEADANQDHSRLLLPAISRLLGDDAPQAVLVTIGPGAYAGIRVGIATAEGLSLALGIPVYGIGTLEAVVLAAGIESGTAVHPAGRGEFAARRWEAGRPADAPTQMSPAALAWAKPFGEGASSVGGTEVTPRQRTEAALRDRAPKIRAGTLEPGAEAFYLREPSITISRRQQAAATSN